MGTFTHTTTGATDQSSIVRGKAGIISGTWDSGNAADGTIVTGGSVVLCHGVTVGSATIPGTEGGTARIVLSEKNKTGSGTSANGSIRVHSIDIKNSLAGDWWAIVKSP